MPKYFQAPYREWMSEEWMNGDFLVANWLRLHPPNARDPSSIPGQGTRSHMLQLKICMLQGNWKSSAVTIARCEQINKYCFYEKNEWMMWSVYLPPVALYSVRPEALCILFILQSFPGMVVMEVLCGMNKWMMSSNSEFSNSLFTSSLLLQSAKCLDL